MPRKLISLLLVMSIASITLLSACSSTSKPNSANDGDNKIKVSVTFDAMKEFVQAVGKDKVEISTIIPDGTEPHDFEPKPKDLAGLSAASVFVYNGMCMETWADSAIEAAGNKNLISVDASTGVVPLKSDESGSSSVDNQYDPHVWISLKGAETEAQNIRDGLDKADPSDKAYFDSNCSDFVSQLQSLFNEYNTKFKADKNKSFVTGHAAFGYLCRDFGLVQNSVEDVFADGEPSPQKLSSLIEYCKANNVKTVFVEDMVSPAVSQTLADEVGAKVEKIYTIESSENNQSYIGRMKINLEEISNSLAQ